MPLNIIIYVDNFLEKSETFIINHINSFRVDNNVLIVSENILYPRLAENYNVAKIPKSKPRTLIKRLFSNRYTLISFRSKEKTRAIEKIIDRFKPDLIHCHFGIQCLNFIHSFDFDTIPVFCTFHGYDVTKLTYKSLAYRRALKKLFKKEYFHPIFVCKYHHDYFKRLAIMSKKSVVIYNGVDVNFFQKSESEIFDASEGRFIQVSRLVEKKGHIFLLKAISLFRVKYPDFPINLTIVGEGPLKKKLINFVDMMQLRDCVDFVGWKSQEELRNLLDDSTYFVQPSITTRENDQEATSITILEAMSMKLPIIATDHAGISEVVHDRINGILIEENNVKALANALLEIRKFSFLEENRARVCKHFNISIQHDKLKSQYLKGLN